MTMSRLVWNQPAGYENEGIEALPELAQVRPAKPVPRPAVGPMVVVAPAFAAEAVTQAPPCGIAAGPKVVLTDEAVACRLPSAARVGSWPGKAAAMVAVAAK